jgi:phosphate starvation-inducible protein PhoH
MSYEFITDIDGNKKAVILQIDEFNEMLEDIEDLAATIERREEDTISHEEVKEILNKYASI